MKNKSNKLNRRQFIGIAGSAGLFGLTGCAGFPSITSVRSPNGLLRHACIGVGNKGRDDWKALMTHPKIEIAALCDVDANFLDIAHKQFPNARVYADWRELFEAEGDRIDSVNISVPDHNHTIVADAAMRRGKHVYLQKPLCKTLRECAYLRDLADDTGVVTQMGAQFNACMSDRQTVEAIRTRLLGPVEKVYLYSTRKGLSRNRRFLPPAEKPPETLNWDLWLGTAAERPYAPKVYHPLIWRVWHDFGGGWVGDIAMHLMSAVWRGMELGSTAPIDVWAEKIVDAEDNVKDIVWPTAAHLVWRFPGVPATEGRPFEIEWFDGCSEPDKLSPANFLPPKEIEALYAASPFGKRPHEGKAVKCRDGWILQPHGVKAAYFVRNDGKKVEPPQLPEAPTHYHEFVDACLEGKRCSTDFAWSTYMMDATLMAESAERMPSGTRLAWNAKSRTFDDARANRILEKPYRKGWELPALGDFA